VSELKTKPTDQNVLEFLHQIQDERKRDDSLKILAMMEKITSETPRMWGKSIVGFGMYHYKSEKSKQEGDWPLIAFSPRKQNHTLYVMTGFKDNQDLLSKLGKHKISVGCLYINHLSDVDNEVLADIIRRSFHHMKQLHET
jgi:hypothetical protein